MTNVYRSFKTYGSKSKSEEIREAQDRKTAQIKDFRQETEFHILVSQSMNLAVTGMSYEDIKKLDAEDIEGRSKWFFQRLLNLRSSPELKILFNHYKNYGNTEDNKGKSIEF